MYGISGDTGAADRLAVRLAVPLYRRIFPRVGFHGAARLGKMPWFRDRSASVTVGGATFTVPAFDAFWAEYVYTDRPYEPEVGHALRRLGAIAPATFLDCGANYGFWSARVASGEFGEHDVTAVEASASTFSVLKQTLGASALHSAVSDELGTMTFAEDGPHQARGLSEAGGTEVATVTIDSLHKGRRHVLIKLDVEGAETAAIRGAAATIAEHEVAFLYEDHASDRECTSTLAMWDAGLHTYYVHPADGRAEPVSDLATVNDLKVERGMGYNFVAVRPEGEYAEALGR